jgi:DNA processing protein
MCNAQRDDGALDTLLRLSLIEGFTVEHLRRLRSTKGDGRADSEAPAPRDSSFYDRARRALDSVESAREAEAVRESCSRACISIVPFTSHEYPAILREISGAPLVLYRDGAPWTGGTAVAIVGSRAPTGPGREFARALAGDLAAAGCVVVSGLARGIDGAAHRGALGTGGSTVAVVGCGVDVAYPPEHSDLRAEVAARGAVYSEYPPGSLPLAWRFPARNRIVSGLCGAVIVAEAPERSGALITARLALEQGREVMAVPGNPCFPHTAGSNRLLREGACPACSAADVLEALGRPPFAAPAGVASRVLHVLAGERHAGEIAAALSLRLTELLPVLTDLEVANLVVRRPGDYYKRKS